MVNPAPEFDKSHLVILYGFFSYQGVTYNPSGYCTGNLPDQNTAFRGCSDYNGSSFIIYRRFWMPRNKKFSRVILLVYHFATNRKPVDMNVVDAHKNRNQLSWFMVKFILIHLFDGNDCSVGTTEDGHGVG